MVPLRDLRACMRRVKADEERFMLQKVVPSVVGVWLMVTSGGASAEGLRASIQPASSADASVPPVSEFAPFGMRFGSTASENQDRLIRYLPLNAPVDVTRMGQSCEEISRSWSGTGVKVSDPDADKISFEYAKNEYGFDFSLGGRVRVGLYRLNFASVPVLGCGMYFDDKLYGAAIIRGAFNRSDADFAKIRQTLQEKYGKYKTSESDNSMFGSFSNFYLPNKVSIQYSSGSGFYGAASVVYMDNAIFSEYLKLGYSGYVAFKRQRLRQFGDGL